MDLALVLATDFECFLSVVGCQDGVPFFRQHQRDQISDHRVVFGKQYDALLRFHKMQPSLGGVRSSGQRPLVFGCPAEVGNQNWG